MKRITWLGLVSTITLSACASAPVIDFSQVNAECGKVCQKERAECATKFADYPILLTTHCESELKTCVKACPAPGAAYTPPVVKTDKDKASTSDRLKEAEDLHKKGLITDQEYADKRQEILKAL
jgi:hypothetical protein